MHYGILVLIDKPEEGENCDRSFVDDAVQSAIEAFGDGKEWDWYQIGGRFSGSLDGYNPEADPANIKTCEYCGGTGDRATFRGEPKENQHPSGCNACLGKGERAEWPTQWGFHPGDVAPVSRLTAEQWDGFYAWVVDEDWFGGEEYQPWKPIGEMFTRREAPPFTWIQEKHGDKLAVVVDCHN